MLNNKSFAAGTLESSDAYVTVEQSSSLDLSIDSSVMKQFGKQIKSVIDNTLNELNVKNAKITIVDRGALDCTIKARICAAVARARKENESWGV